MSFTASTNSFPTDHLHRHRFPCTCVRSRMAPRTYVSPFLPQNNASLNNLYDHIITDANQAETLTLIRASPPEHAQRMEETYFALLLGNNMRFHANYAIEAMALLEESARYIDVNHFAEMLDMGLTSLYNYTPPAPSEHPDTPPDSPSLESVASVPSTDTTRDPDSSPPSPTLSFYMQERENIEPIPTPPPRAQSRRDTRSIRGTQVARRGRGGRRSKQVLFVSGLPFSFTSQGDSQEDPINIDKGDSPETAIELEDGEILETPFHTPPTSPPSPLPPRSTYKCWNCKRVGHICINCPTFRCVHCKTPGPGHLPGECSWNPARHHPWVDNGDWEDNYDEEAWSNITGEPGY